MTIDKGDTWPKVLKYNCEKHGDSRTAMRHKRYGIWQSYTWKEYFLRVKYLALGLLSLGFKSGDKLLIIGDNAPEWYYAELAAQTNHGASVGIYADSNATEIRQIAANSDARFAIVENQEQVDKILEMRNDLPMLERVIYWNYKGLAHYKNPALMGYRQVEELGANYEKEHPDLFEQNVATGSPDDVCAIVYTSGTTGSAKGAIHTFRSMRASSDYYLQLDAWYEHDDIVPYLPPVWMTEQSCGIGCHLLAANVLNFAEAPETQQRDTRETGPSIVIYAARLWENQAATLRARMTDTSTVKRLFVSMLMPVGYKMADPKLQGKRADVPLKILYWFADRVLFKPIKKSMGLSNARICYSTGSVLSADGFRFYHALGLPLKCVYGTTESGPVAAARNDDIRLETVGPVKKDAEVRVAENGELMFRAPALFAGYYKDEERTEEVLRDGWFYSGDTGVVSDDGHIVFQDRIGEIIDLPGEEKLSPQLLEARLRVSPYIKDAWVVGGPKKRYVSAIIVINYDTVSRWAGQRRVAFSTFAELSQKPEVYELIGRDIDRVNSDLPPAFKIKKYVNLYKEFDPDENELTRNRKLRKRFLEERFRDLIQAIYSNKSAVPIEAHMSQRDGRTGVIKTTLAIKTNEGAIS